MGGDDLQWPTLHDGVLVAGDYPRFGDFAQQSGV
ncbi:Uncharacterised protein [Yersinia enterocolitica]|nr:Uncharacterised protein [Yersinia enterocolitica]